MVRIDRHLFHDSSLSRGPTHPRLPWLTNVTLGRLSTVRMNLNKLCAMQGRGSCSKWLGLRYE